LVQFVDYRKRLSFPNCGVDGAHPVPDPDRRGHPADGRALGGTYYFQGYIYLEPSPNIYWQAPVAAAVLTSGYMVWCVTLATTPGASPQSLPYDTIIRFNPTEDMLSRPAPRIWAVKSSSKKGQERKDGEKIRYVSKRDGPTRYHYQDTSIKPRLWQGQNVIAIEIEKDDGTTIRFDYEETDDGGHRRFRSKDGWEMLESPQDGPTGLPTRFRSSRLFWNLFFNLGHFSVWFVTLWLILRYQWIHAFGLAIVLWVVFTLTMLPMLLGYAGHAAASRQSVRTISARIDSLDRPDWALESLCKTRSPKASG
jgi:hypothetical protein